jgi:diguanylate cyclase (GGDEF)-like protein
MKNNSNFRLIGYIIIIIIFGFTITSVMNYNSNNKILREDAQNITKLTAMTIFAEIQNELTKPIFVGLTMANDSFVKSWLKSEAYSDPMIINNYLNGIKEKYGYSSAFLVSGVTSTYYNTDGVLKKVSLSDPHDIWFYNFINSNKDYALDVDTDQGNNNALSVFINSRISNAGDESSSVIGVGLEMSEIQKILNYYNELLNLDIILIDSSGFIQVDTDESAIERNNFFTELDNPKLKERILSNNEDFEIFKETGSKGDSYIFARYIKDLDWYLIVRNNTIAIQASFRNQQYINILVAVLVVLLVVLMTVILIRRYQKKLIHLATTDFLTGSNNRRAMIDNLEHIIVEVNKTQRPLSLFAFDIDDFKKINDTYGHMVGDQSLVKITEIVQNYLGNENQLARWGGDEFIGILYKDKDSARSCLDILREKISQNDELLPYNITVSIGIAEYVHGQTQDQLIYKADQAMYSAKESGKNKVR